MFDSAQVQWNASRMQEKMAEYAYAVLKDKPAFHINFVMDISPNCDCWGFNDVPISSNIGILASFDPVAIDQASADLVNQVPENHKPAASGYQLAIKDKFRATHPNVDWKITLQHAEAIGLGTMQYELIKVE
jgi:hypothetical protein